MEGYVEALGYFSRTGKGFWKWSIYIYIYMTHLHLHQFLYRI